MDIPLIKKLIHLLNNNNLGELKVQEGDMKITIRHRDYRGASNTGTKNANESPTQVSLTGNAGEKKNESPIGNFITITAPMIGTFYRSSTPDKEPFVK